jgi:hypothetical protein
MVSKLKLFGKFLYYSILIMRNRLKYIEIEKYFYVFQLVSIYFNFRKLRNIYRSIKVTDLCKFCFHF